MMISDNFFTIKDVNMSLLTEAEQHQVFSLFKKYQVRHTQITPSQQLRIFGISAQEFNLLQEDLHDLIWIPNGITVTYVQTCPGKEQCKHAMANSFSLGSRLRKLTFNFPLPHKVKVSIAGCRICCTEPYVRDVGIIAERHGWKVVFGGNAGGKPRIADTIATQLSEDEVVAIVQKSLQFYIAHARPKQRTARFIEQFGIEKFIKKIL